MGAVTVVSRWLFDWAFAASPQSGLAWFCFLFPLIEPDASGSRKRLTLSPAAGSRSDVVTGPNHTHITFSTLGSGNSDVMVPPRGRNYGGILSAIEIDHHHPSKFL